MTTTEETLPGPALTIRDKALKAVIWENRSDEKSWFSIALTRTYKAGDKFKDTARFHTSDLLALSRLIGTVYDEVRALEDQNKN